MELFGKWTENIDELSKKFISSQPFSNITIPNFLNDELAEKIYNEFPDKFDNWHIYMNPLEVKYSNNNIQILSGNTYNLFKIFESEIIVKLFSKLSKISDLETDLTLHGAGLHAHPRYGRLSMHLDYEKHPILKNKQRRINIILFLNKKWDKSWKGSNQLWDKELKECKVETYPEFNKALIFKTNDVSWHGVPEKIMCPKNIFRKSLAYYYISPLFNKSVKNKFGNDGSGYRTKASFIKTPLEKYDERIEKLFKIRPFRRITKKDMDEIWPDWDPVNN